MKNHDLTIRHKSLSFGITLCPAQMAARPKSSFLFYEKLSIYVSPMVSGKALFLFFTFDTHTFQIRCFWFNLLWLEYFSHLWFDLTWFCLLTLSFAAPSSVSQTLDGKVYETIQKTQTSKLYKTETTNLYMYMHRTIKACKELKPITIHAPS